MPLSCFVVAFCLGVVLSVEKHFRAVRIRAFKCFATYRWEFLSDIKAQRCRSKNMGKSFVNCLQLSNKDFEVGQCSFVYHCIDLHEIIQRRQGESKIKVRKISIVRNGAL